jgi:poly-gamma-glutamate capsule biosynthesis protein CapA/YwtB (metallophosphatase superfamily)
MLRRLPLLALAALCAALAAGPGRSSRPPVVTISAVGDIAMVDGPTATYFARVTRYLEGDVVLGNLEGTLASGGASKCGRSPGPYCFAFRAPPSSASSLRRAGFTIVNLANNHAYDFGPEGQAETIAALDRVRLRHTGRPGEITYLKTGNVRVAVLGFAPQSWAQDLRDLAAARRLVRAASTRAAVVVVTMHAGAEGKDAAHVRPGTEVFLGENRGNAVAFAHAVVDAGADLVVGHGPHVLRGMEWYRGRLIAYSLGNFLGYRALNVSGSSGLSALLRVRLRRDGSWLGAEIVPITLQSGGIPRRDPAGAAHEIVRRLSREDFGRRAMRVTRRGELLPPAWRTG